jgi:hypothetical protein
MSSEGEKIRQSLLAHFHIGKKFSLDVEIVDEKAIDEILKSLHGGTTVGGIRVNKLHFEEADTLEGIYDANTNAAMKTLIRVLKGGPLEEEN